MGVSFAYAFIPLVFLVAIKLFNTSGLYSSVLVGFVISLQVLFDPRIAALTIGSLTLFYLIRFEFHKKDFLYFAAIPGLIIMLLHLYWILPLIFYKPNIIPQGFDSLSGVKFLSFAFLENSLSLLHPNWPENIFGKVSFMRSEFLVFPVLAYSSLLFLNSKLKIQRIILFFALLGLISAFLAKGTQEPFGGIYIWLFQHIPGFSLFRDSTKFYMLIALSYSILVPFSLWKISEKALVVKNKILYKNLIIISFILFWIFSLRLLFVPGQLKIHQVPESYVQLKDFIASQNQFFRTLWIPSWQRYGYFSDINPAVGRGELFKHASTSAMISELKEKGKEVELQDFGIKYVIVPEDSEGEIFLDDRRYSERIYKKTILEIEKIKGMKKIRNFGKIVVFEISNPRDKFWISSSNKNAKVSYKMINSTKYLVSVKNINKNDIIVFSERFDPNWTMKNSEFKVKSSKLENKLNNFVLPKTGKYSFEVYYQPQKLVNIGLIISVITLALIIIYLIRFKKN
jgi:hypothetical protein